MLTDLESIEVSLSCTECLNSFPSGIALKEHECSKKRANTQCNVCHKMYVNSIISLNQFIILFKITYELSTFTDINRFTSFWALKVHCQKQNEYSCGVCSKVFCKPNALKMHKLEECESTNTEREIDTPENDIAATKVEFHDDEDIGSAVDENPLTAPFETSILPLVSHHTRMDRKLIATQKRKKSNKINDLNGNKNNKYDCYLCNKR